MNTSHILLNKSDMEIAVDANYNEVDEDYNFDFTMGTGFTAFNTPTSVNVEIKVTIDELIEIQRQLAEVIKLYTSPVKIKYNPSYHLFVEGKEVYRHSVLERCLQEAETYKKSWYITKKIDGFDTVIAENIQPKDNQ